MAASKNEKQVMDVSKPGKTPADASARPVIVGHKTLVQDPMVNADVNSEAATTEAEAEPAPPSPSTGKKVIAPLEDSTTSETTPETTPAAEITNEQKPEETEKPAAEEKLDEPPVESEESTDSAVVDAVIDQVGNKKKENELSEEDRKRQEHLDKLVEEKKYFVPIGKAHKGSSRLLLIFTLLLLVVFIGLVLAIDAEMLDVGFSLPFDLIKSR